MRFWLFIVLLVAGCADRLPPRVPTPERFQSLFASLPGADEKPTPYWTSKALDRFVSLHTPARRYLELPTKAQALAAMIRDNEAGFKDRLYEFGLRYIEFLPDELYTYDPATGERTPGIELAAFSNVRASADAVWRGGDFFTLYDFPLEALRFRYAPVSDTLEQSLTFSRDWLTKPFFRVLTNSLSNRNRKRASWLLRNFLCDDLSTAAATPSAGDSHPAMEKQRHATEIGCKTCHWKLDYVGAFFRYYDSWGNDFQKRGKFIEFAQQAIYRDKGWDDWMSEWKRDDGRWYAGVHRNALDPSPRDWDATSVSADPVPADLFNFLKTDGDANRCLAKRMAERFVGANVTYDPEWLTELGKSFHAKGSSGDSFLRVLGTLAFSRGFSTANPDPNAYYDSVTQTHGYPAAVYRILESQCLSCHDGAFLDAKKSTMKERLETRDTSRRMPYGKAALSREDIATLTEWAQ